MKSILSSVSLLLTVLHLAVTMSSEPVKAQVTIPNPEMAGTNSLTQGHSLLTQAVNLPDIGTMLDQDKVTQAVPIIEQTWEKQYEDYFGINLSDQSMMAEEIAATLGKVAAQTGKKPAVLYIIPRPQQLELVLITPEGKPIHKRVLEANNEALLQQLQQLKNSISHLDFVNTNYYLPPAQQLYQWMIAPLEADLQAHKIDTLLFCMGAGLRTLPLATLHDGQQFLVEKYSFSRIPAFKLTDTVYAGLKSSQVLAMGASTFQDQPSLPAVPAELSNIVEDLWSGKLFLNQDFTLANLQSQRQQNSFKIIHLATHADFQPGKPSNSFIQFWDEKLTLAQMRQLGWQQPPVELLVLSACKTAIGDKEVELGFAGLAVQARVKSALASLWYVSDEGTLGLMTEFYRSLKTAPIKAEALRQAQIAMLTGQVRLADGQLHSSRGNTPLPPALASLENENLSHPYYWAAFTLVGSPW
ncbi:CHAT domain-containing protein [Lyngbya aestuarii]|uniref:CHAT domain-containing protein n=1 Tax=Lyngbya aestuarii TaxID=118322 RepID=UPI00403D9BF3